MQAGFARSMPRPFQKWWLKAQPPLTVYSIGPLHGWQLTVPWWAWPLELLHRLVFGYPRLEA